MAACRGVVRTTWVHFGKCMYVFVCLVLVLCAVVIVAIRSGRRFSVYTKGLVNMTFFLMLEYITLVIYLGLH